MADVTTVHRHDGREQVTDKVIDAGAVTYRFRGPPDGDLEDYEYLNDGEPPEVAKNALEDHFEEGGDE